MNRFFVIVSRLITHHIKITHHALTWIALTHFYFLKKQITILSILSVPFIIILLRKDFIIGPLIIKIIRNLMVGFILIKLTSLITVNQMIMNIIQNLYIFISFIFPRLAQYFGMDLVLQHAIVILILKKVDCLIHLKSIFLGC